jgi:hypothetical protein
MYCHWYVMYRYSLLCSYCSIVYSYLYIVSSVSLLSSSVLQGGSRPCSQTPLSDGAMRSPLYIYTLRLFSASLLGHGPGSTLNSAPCTGATGKSTTSTRISKAYTEYFARGRPKRGLQDAPLWDILALGHM